LISLERAPPAEIAGLQIQVLKYKQKAFSAYAALGNRGTDVGHFRAKMRPKTN